MKTAFAIPRSLATLFVVVALMTLAVAPVTAIQQPHGAFGGPPAISLASLATGRRVSISLIT